MASYEVDLALAVAPTHPKCTTAPLFSRTPATGGTAPCPGGCEARTSCCLSSGREAGIYSRRRWAVGNTSPDGPVSGRPGSGSSTPRRRPPRLVQCGLVARAQTDSGHRNCDSARGRNRETAASAAASAGRRPKRAIDASVRRKTQGSGPAGVGGKERQEGNFPGTPPPGRVCPGGIPERDMASSRTPPTRTSAGSGCGTRIRPGARRRSRRRPYRYGPHA